ncbi:MAG: PKD domain-containing protein [Chitinophagales bacterium]|nr:PKD domain-containing protein [Chitinophagales bacterium]
MRNSILFCTVIFALFLTKCGKDNPKISNKHIDLKVRFYADSTELKQGSAINFTDSSEGFPFKWQWYFEGGTPSTSTEQHPKNITYNSLGEFSVKLIVKNAYGEDSLIKKSYIKVNRELRVPILETTPAYEINAKSAKSGGIVLDKGNSELIEVGVVWDTLPYPSTLKFYAISTLENKEDFQIVLNNLKDDTKYYYRAYAKNSDGLGYGEQYYFTTPILDTCDFIETKFTDSRDGQVYRYTIIGGKKWMGDNLNYETNNSWCYSDRETNCEKFGRLYTIEAASNACPPGWILPTTKDWDNLIASIGTSSATQLMKKGEWQGAPATNNYCFSALPGGYKNIETGKFNTVGFYGYWWTSSKGNDNKNLAKNISYDNTDILPSAYENNMALSVRCIEK